jgi:CHAD domain-containing protein
MNRAYRRPGTSAFHAWRRAVKTHRFQLRFLAPLAPEDFGARIEDLALLGDLLGQEHDLAVLRKTLAAQRDCFDDPRDRARFLELLKSHRQDKRDRARPLGERLFADRPSVMRRRIHRYFRAFRRGPSAERV